MKNKVNARGFIKRGIPLMAFLLVLGFLAAMPFAAQGQQIAIDSANNSYKDHKKTPNGNNSLEWSHTVNGALPYRKLVVLVTAKDQLSQNINFDYVRFGNTDLVNVIDERKDGASHRQLSGIFYLDNPPAGTQTVRVQLGHGAEFYVAGAYTLYNAAPGGAVATHKHTGNSSNAGGGITTPVTHCMVMSALALNGNHGASAQAPSVELFSERLSSGGGYFRGAGSYRIVPAASGLTMLYSNGSDHFAHSLAAFQSVGRIVVNLNGPATARWNAETTDSWLASGASVDLPPGDYIVAADTQANLTKPEDVLVTTLSGQTITKNLSYTANLAYSAAANGSVSGTVAQTINYGANGTQVVAVPDPGYQFDAWSDGGTTASRTDSNVRAHKNVTATFKERYRTVAYEVSPQIGGTIIGDDTIQDSIGEIELTVTANVGYDVGTVNVEATNGTVTPLDPLGSGKFLLTNVTGNTTVTAEFGASEYNVSYVTDPSGIGSITGGAAVIQAALGTTQFSVNAPAGYTTFLVTATRGAITNLGNGNYRLSHVTRDTVVTAAFVKTMRSISFTVDGEGTFTALPTIQDTVGVMEFTFVPAPGKTFLGFEYDYAKAVIDSLGNNTYRLRNVTGNLSVLAHTM